MVAREGLDETIVDFCRFARANGLPAGVKESLVALEAVSVVGVSDRQTLKAALRAVLCSSQADWEKFGEVFEAFWGLGEGELQRSEHQQKPEPAVNKVQPQWEEAGLLRPAAGKARVTEE